MSRGDGSGERVLLTKGRIARALRMVLYVLALAGIAFLYAVDDRSPLAIAQYILGLSVLVLLAWYDMTFERPGQVRADGEGLTFKKGKASRSFPWSGVERVAMSTVGRWPRAHVFLVEPVDRRAGDFSFYWNMVDFEDERHLVLTSSNWRAGDVRELYSSMKAIVARRVDG